MRAASAGSCGILGAAVLGEFPRFFRYSGYGAGGLQHFSTRNFSALAALGGAQIFTPDPLAGAGWWRAFRGV
jgi:hypothetical protein